VLSSHASGVSVLENANFYLFEGLGKNSPATTWISSEVTRVLSIRNRAAHPDVNGKIQKIDEDSVRKLLDDINVMLLKLSNVGIAIDRYRAQQG
jgi:hypothetical protein